MKQNSINIFEHETLHVASSKEDLFDDNGERVKITPEEFVSLQRFHSRISKDFFSLSHKRIKLKHYVGLLRVGKLNINILPKIDKLESDKNKWHNILIQMILFTKRFRYKRSTMAMLKVSESSILDLYIYEFYREVEEVLRQGLRKSYSFKDGNITNIKGKILFNRDVVVNSSDRSKTYCRYQVYRQDNIMNFVLQQALKMSLSMTSSMSLIETGKNLLSMFPEMSNYTLSSKVLNEISFNRNNSYYKSAMALAKIIIQDTGFDLSSGSENVVSFLFDMNQLFEEFMYKICKRSFRDSEFEVHRTGKRFWEKKLIKPDIVIENSKDGKVVIFDTKWKIPKDLKPNDADLKQIFVYNHYYCSPVSYLLYPSNKEEENTESLILPGNYHEYILNGEKLKNSCYLGFMPINKDGKLDINGAQKRIRDMFVVASKGEK